MVWCALFSQHPEETVVIGCLCCGPQIAWTTKWRGGIETARLIPCLGLVVRGAIAVVQREWYTFSSVLKVFAVVPVQRDRSNSIPLISLKCLPGPSLCRSHQRTRWGVHAMSVCLLALVVVADRAVL